MTDDLPSLHNDGVGRSAIDPARQIHRTGVGHEWFQTMIEQAPVAMCLFVGREQRIDVANEAMIAVWGKGTGVMGQPLADALPELRDQHFLVTLDTLFTTGEPFRERAGRADLVIAGQRQTFYFDYDFKPLRDAAGVVYGILETAIDVTEQVLTRQALDQKSRDLELAVSVANLGSFRIDLTTRTVTYSQPVMDWFGLTRQHQPLADIVGCIHADDRDAMVDQIRRSVAGQDGGHHDLTYRVAGPGDGRLRYLHSVGQVAHEEGTPVSISGIIQDVTQAAVAQHKLAESERNLRRMIEQAPVAIAIYKGADSVVETANDLMLELAGKTADEFIGKPLFESLPEVKSAGLEEIIGRVLHEGIPYKAYAASFTLPRPTGPATLYADFVCEPFREEDGRISGVIVVAIDTTEQVMARQRLAESETRFQAMAEESSILIALSDQSSHVTYFSRAWTDLTGRPTTDLINDGWADLIHADDRERFVRTYLTAFTNQEPYTSEFRLLSHTGAYHWLLAEGHPRFGADGAFLGCINSSVDITSARQAQDALRVSEAKLRSIVTNAPVGIGLFVGRELIIESPNQTFIDIVGKGWGIVGRPLRDAMPELVTEDQPFLAILDNVYTTGQMFQSYGSLVQIVQQGRMTNKYYNITYTPVLDARGEVYAILDIAVDVTGQIMAQQHAETSEARYRDLAGHLDEQVQLRTQELAAINEELGATNEELIATNDDLILSNQLLETVNHDLARSNENLEQFAYVASHDLQEPLRKIQQFGDLLKNRYSDIGSEERLYLDRMQVAASRMSQLIKDLLTFSRISTSQVVTQPVLLSDVIGRARENLSVAIDESAAVIEVGALPIVRGDLSQLSQLFQNLLSNALKFRRTGPTGEAIAPHIRIQASEVPGEALPAQPQLVRSAAVYQRIEVIDNGIGLDEKYRDRIFQVFQRLHSRHEFAGTGVGLAIAQKVVANHGGVITVSSEPGQGATFSVYLPAREAQPGK